MYPPSFDTANNNNNIATSSSTKQSTFPQPPPGGRRVLVGDSAASFSPIGVFVANSTTTYVDIPSSTPHHSQSYSSNHRGNGSRSNMTSNPSSPPPQPTNNNSNTMPLPNRNNSIHQQQQQRSRRNIIVGCVTLLALALLLTIFWPMGRGGDQRMTTAGGRPPLSPPPSSHHHPLTSTNQHFLEKVALSPDFDYYKDFDRSLSDAHQLYANTTHLIIVAGHSVFTGSNWNEWASPSNWAFEPFQRREGAGEVLVNTYNQHTIRGLEVLTGLKSVDACRSTSSTSTSNGENQPERTSLMAKQRNKELAPSTDADVIRQRRRELQTRLLIFSGGASRQQAGPRTEGTSYYQLAEVNRFYGLFGNRYSFQDGQKNAEGATNNVIMSVDDNDYTENGDAIRGGTPFAKRFIATEDFARDSYENLLFSVYRFREVTGRFPLKVTVVGYEYKRRRFTDVHRAAMRIPLEMFEYIGIDSLEAELLLHYEKRSDEARVIPQVVLDRYSHVVLNGSLSSPLSSSSSSTSSITPDSFFDAVHPPGDTNSYKCAQSTMVSSHTFAPPKNKKGDTKNNVIGGGVGDAASSEAAKLPWVFALSDEATVNYVRKDPYLCESNRGTRRVRNPLRRTPPYYLSAPPGAARELLGWCGPEMFPKRLPWSS